MYIGIVGAEGAKFTQDTEAKARAHIREIIKSARKGLDAAGRIGEGITVVSGKCHLGGIDIWAIEEAKKLYCLTTEHPPKTQDWAGFKARNITIAEVSEEIFSIVVKTLPPGFKEGGWERFCYHCKSDQHIKSGGCWTVKYAREKFGTPGHIIVVE